MRSYIYIYYIYIYIYIYKVLFLFAKYRHPDKFILPWDGVHKKLAKVNVEKMLV